MMSKSGHHSAADRSRAGCGGVPTPFSCQSQFYLVFPEGYSRGDIPDDEIGYTVCSELSGSHYRLLMRRLVKSLF